MENLVFKETPFYLSAIDVMFAPVNFYLVLCENHLTGPIPRCLGNLSQQLQILEVRARCSPL